MVQVKVYCNNVKDAKAMAKWDVGTREFVTADFMHKCLSGAHADLVKERAKPKTGDTYFRILASVTTIKNSDLNPVSI